MGAARTEARVVKGGASALSKPLVKGRACLKGDVEARHERKGARGDVARLDVDGPAGEAAPAARDAREEGGDDDEPTDAHAAGSTKKRTAAAVHCASAQWQKFMLKIRKQTCTKMEGRKGDGQLLITTRYSGAARAGQ